MEIVPVGFSQRRFGDDGSIFHAPKSFVSSHEFRLSRQKVVCNRGDRRRRRIGLSKAGTQRPLGQQVQGHGRLLRDRR